MRETYTRDGKFLVADCCGARTPIPRELAHVRGCPVASRFDLLTPRQCEIAMELGQGKTRKAIAMDLNVSYATVDAHVTDLFRRLGIHSSVELARLVLLEEQRLEAQAAEKKIRKVAG